jgi:hypothetical protein
VGEWSTPRPGRFTSGKETQHPVYKKLGGAQGLSERMQKFSPLPGFDPRTVQPVASRYIDYAIPAHGRYWEKQQKILNDKYTMICNAI